jgi:sec-independent protein translocase protein TatA
MPFVLGINTLGPMELLIILLIILAVFGASKLAGIGGALGGGIREFRKAVRDENEKAADTSTSNETHSNAIEPGEQKIS